MLAAVLGLVWFATGAKKKNDELVQPKGDDKPIVIPKVTLDYAAMDKLGWKLCSQAYTFREMSLFETIDLLKGLGIKYIEMYPGQRYSKEKPGIKADHNMSADMVDGLIAKLKEAGVTPVNYGVVNCGKTEAEARKVFSFAKKLGLISIVSEPEESTIPMLDKLCQEYGINIAIHEHMKPNRYWDPHHVLEVCQGRSAHIGACSDVGHWRRSGIEPLDGLKIQEGHIISLHFKDLVADARGHGGWMDVPWGTGKSNARGMLEEVKRQGIHPVFSVEYETGHGQELVDNVAKSIQWFSAQATELAK